jgi:hypothetical protein
VSDIVAVFYYKLATVDIDISMFLNWMQSPPDPCFLCWRGGRVGSREEEAMNSIVIVEVKEGEVKRCSMILIELRGSDIGY